CKDINTEKITDLTLAKGNKPNLTKDYFNGDFVVYDKAWFYTTKYQGVRLGLEYGSYKLFLCIHAKKSDISKEIALSFAQEFEMQTESEHKKFRLKADKDSMELTIE
ncbi:MAG: hypothetical protein LBG21_07750, partial [Campylobacteraceae bacterium]|nr:hypothetical protein [Campylobacteraceae bacterium]